MVGQERRVLGDGHVEDVGEISKKGLIYKVWAQLWLTEVTSPHIGVQAPKAYCVHSQAHVQLL
jgi:hypothetical protein